MSNCQVSVVVLTYNSDWLKLKRTLLRIMEQKGVSFEIIISDDGSRKDNFDNVEKLFQEHSFKHYNLIKQERNLGIVKNYLSAIEKSKGDYIAGSSPGDYLYSNDALAKMYAFAVSKKADVCYGNFAAYSGENEIKVYENMILPHHAHYFADGDIEKQKVAFFLAGDILPGCAIFRSRKYALTYIGIVSKVCTYVEDNTSLMYSFVDNVPIYHFDEYFVWYEVGFGISTQRNEIWDKRMAIDMHNAVADLKHRYNEDPYVDFFAISNTNMNKFRRSCLLTFKHPILRMKKMILKFGNKRLVQHNIVDMSKFLNEIVE